MAMNSTLYRTQLTLERGAMINELYALNQWAVPGGLREEIRTRLRRIDQALRCIEAGEFEVCGRCGAVVMEDEEAVLALEAVYCRDCERQIH